MKILFLQFGSRYFYNKNNNCFYTDGSLNEKIWNRYLNYTKELTVIGKKANKTITNSDTEKLNEVNKNINLILVDDIYQPKSNYFKMKLRKQIKSIISKEIDNNDLIVIRSITNDYNLFAAKYCISKNKKYVVEVTGFGNSLWYHASKFGKIMSPIIHYRMKNTIKKSENVLYVTNYALQKYYPTKYNSVGCSDVEIKIDEQIILNKIKRINEKFDSKSFTLGTIGPLDSKLKGQEYVIKAISYLNNNLNYSIKYELVGRGDKEYLLNIAKKYKVEDNVIFIGEVNHDKIFDWLEKLDIYIQTSFSEGLCRSIVEAMSYGCPIIATSVGGNIELTSQSMQFKKGNTKQLIRIIKNINKEKVIQESKNSFELAKKFEKSKLNKLRNDFYEKIIKEIEEE